ncbi:MAG: Ykof family thiamine-binding protein [Defluviitaleaceae bacterium]|nr:Ykof family thiamine-binding protein [Defluviitaleaceae bacterium]MCL2275584.1 Ykof family thiamine-binding protein [Defluviitaleaceae bacterium]
MQKSKGITNAKGITGCRFSLSVMSDNYAAMILDAIGRVNTRHVWCATDALSTVYRGTRPHVVEGVRAVFTAVNDGKTHITLDATFSSGCPNDQAADYVGTDTTPVMGDYGASFPVIGKIAFYPLGAADYMEHISAVAQMAEAFHVNMKASHYATELAGDVNNIFAYFNHVLAYAEENITHYVLHAMLSVNSPGLKRSESHVELI